jgi:hypothetical protein
VGALTAVDEWEGGAETDEHGTGRRGEHTRRIAAGDGTGDADMSDVHRPVGQHGHAGE